MIDKEQKYRIRFIAVFIRAIHLTASAVILGGFFVKGSFADIRIFIYLSLASGLLLLVMEWLRHPQLFAELAGWSTILKISLLVIAGIYHQFAIPLLFTAFIVSCIGAHLPKNWRMRRMF